ncbi:MAG: DUF4337 domain-containing protein [Limisphaerales bacterium]
MAEEKKETWLNWLAITTIIFSATSTFSSFKGGGFSTKAVLEQSFASDTWAFYQAKSLKQHAFELQRDLLQVELLRPGVPAAALNAKIGQYEKEISRYKKEKDQAQDEARRHEVVRDEARGHGSQFGMAVVYLQMAITLSAIAALLKKRPLWYVGIVCGAAGLVYFANGHWLFFGKQKPAVESAAFGTPKAGKANAPEDPNSALNDAVKK